MATIDKVFEENKVLIAIQTHLRGAKTRGKETRFNCPVCVVRGETPDKRMRGGMGYDAFHIGINCFNCDFKTRFDMGSHLGRNMKLFLSQIGVSSIEIARLNYWAASLSYLKQQTNKSSHDEYSSIPSFTNRSLPTGSRPILELIHENCTDENFMEVAAYIYGRSEEIADSTQFYWTPYEMGKVQLHRRLIIPCFSSTNEVVGWIGRSIDNTVPKYYNETPTHFLFNYAALDKPYRKFVILVEGVIDALSIDAVGLLGAHLHEQQANWINSTDKDIIVLPDRDKAGARMIDMALKYDWKVSFPRPFSLGRNRGWWDNDIKDAADAVSRYGRLYTLRSIIESATDVKMKIHMLRRNFPT